MLLDVCIYEGNLNFYRFSSHVFDVEAKDATEIPLSSQIKFFLLHLLWQMLKGALSFRRCMREKYFPIEAFNFLLEHAKTFLLQLNFRMFLAFHDIYAFENTRPRQKGEEWNQKTFLLLPGRKFSLSF